MKLFLISLAGCMIPCSGRAQSITGNKQSSARDTMVITLDTMKINARPLVKVTTTQLAKMFSACTDCGGYWDSRYLRPFIYGDCLCKIIPHASQVKMGMRRTEDFNMFFWRTTHPDQIALYIDGVRILQPYDMVQAQ